jgi:hypothetical protein
MVLPQITIDLMEAYAVLGPLALIVGGITVYGVFVFNFYRFLARKDIFTLNLQKHNQAKRPALRKAITVIFYVFKCLMLYPVFVFFWFGVMAVLLYLLSRNHSTETVMLIAMGVIGAIRICAYYKEALSTDIAKILPFALLGIMLIDNSVIRILESTETVQEVALQWETVVYYLVYYLVAVVALELLLRMTTGIFGFFRDRGRSRKQKKQALTPKPQVATGGPQSGAWSPAYEPRPVGLGSAPSTSSRTPVMNSKPAFVNGGSNGRESVSEESADLSVDPLRVDMPEATEWVRRRPVYAHRQ